MSVLSYFVGAYSVNCGFVLFRSISTGCFWGWVLKFGFFFVFSPLGWLELESSNHVCLGSVL